MCYDCVGKLGVAGWRASPGQRLSIQAAAVCASSRHGHQNTAPVAMLLGNRSQLTSFSLTLACNEVKGIEINKKGRQRGMCEKKIRDEWKEGLSSIKRVPVQS